MSMGCSTMTDLKINDMDIAEINGFWVYQNTKNKNLQLMVKLILTMMNPHQIL